MNHSFSYRINPLLFLVGMLIAVIGQWHWLPWVAAFNSASNPVVTQQLLPQSTVPALLLLHADALVLPMSNSTTKIMARVRDEKGMPVAGVLVQFQATLGSVNPASVATDGDGVASSTFLASGSAGHAQIVASTSGLQRQTAIQLMNPALAGTHNSLTLESDTLSLNAEQETSFTAILRNNAGQPIAGEVVSLFGSLGQVTPASALSDGNGRIHATFRAGKGGGLATLTVLAGTATKSMNIRINTPNLPSAERKLYLPIINR